VADLLIPGVGVVQESTDTLLIPGSGVVEAQGSDDVVIPFGGRDGGMDIYGDRLGGKI
jgi:hypothetical protein